MQCLGSRCGLRRDSAGTQGSPSRPSKTVQNLSVSGRYGDFLSHRGTLKSSIFMGFSSINPFGGTPCMETSTWFGHSWTIQIKDDHMIWIYLNHHNPISQFAKSRPALSVRCHPYKRLTHWCHAGDRRSWMFGVCCLKKTLAGPCRLLQTLTATMQPSMRVKRVETSRWLNIFSKAWPMTTWHPPLQHGIHFQLLTFSTQ